MRMWRNHSDVGASQEGSDPGGAGGWSPGDVLAVLEHSATFLQASVSGLKNERLDDQEVIDDATVRDIMTHLAAWEDEFLREAQHAARRGAAPFSWHIRPSASVGGCVLAAVAVDDDDRFDREQRERWRDEATGAIFLALERSQQQLIAFARSLTPRALAQQADWPWGRRSTLAELLVTAASHKRGHAEAIRGWRTRGAF